MRWFDHLGMIRVAIVFQFVLSAAAQAAPNRGVTLAVVPPVNATSVVAAATLPGRTHHVVSCWVGGGLDTRHWSTRSGMPVLGARTERCPSGSKACVVIKHVTNERDDGRGGMKTPSWFEGRCSADSFDALAAHNADEKLQSEASKFKDGCIEAPGPIESLNTYYCHVDNCNEFYACDYSNGNIPELASAGGSYVAALVLFGGFVLFALGALPRCKQRTAGSADAQHFPPFGVGVSGGIAEREHLRGTERPGLCGHSDRLNP